MPRYDIWFERPTDGEPHKVLGGPYEEVEAKQLMEELAEVHDEDVFWLEVVA